MAKEFEDYARDWNEAHPYFCVDCGHQFGIADTVAGQTQLMFTAGTQSLEHVPSPGFEMASDTAPAGMSKEIVARLNAEIGRILFLAEVKKRMEDIAVETAKSSPEEPATLTRADADKWGKIIKQLGITPQ
jgi:hypothetical protein